MSKQGQITVVDNRCALTALGKQNARNILLSVLNRDGISEFYRIIKPYMEGERADKWVQNKYYNIMRNLIFNNYDILSVLTSAKSLDEVLIIVSVLRKRDVTEDFIREMKQKFDVLKDMELIEIRRHNDGIDYLQITESGIDVLSSLFQQVSSMYREDYEPPKRNFEYKYDNINSFVKKYVIIAGILFFVFFFTASAITSDVFNALIWSTMLFMFLSLVFLYKLLSD
jgi:hypothetical protein